MAKAKAEITISRIIDIASVTRYYILQSSTLAKPAAPTANPPGGSWVTTEPSYTSGSTNTLYFVDLTIFTNSTFKYSAVSKSSSYEAAKTAYNKAVNAQSTADSALTRVTVKDTRSANENPQWYMTNYPKQIVMEFKNCSAIGLSGDTYCSLETMVPWGDSSGGYPKQVAKVKEKQYWRVGTSTTAWGSWIDAYGTAVNAAKTATNYLGFSSAGLVVGDMTKATLGRNVLIDADSVDIRNGTTILSSFSDNLLQLGKKAENSAIELCGGSGKIIAEGDGAYDWKSTIKMEARNLKFDSERFFSYTSRASTDGKSTAHTQLSANTSWEGIYADTDGDGVSTKVDDGIHSNVGFNVEAKDTVRNKRKDAGVSVTSKISRTTTVSDWDEVRAQMYARDWTSGNDNFFRLYPDRTISSQNLFISAKDKAGWNDGKSGWYFGVDGTAHVSNDAGGSTIGFHYAKSTAATSRIAETSSGVISINGMRFGVNKVLWSGGYFMTETHTITLSEAISKQTNGVVLVWREYTSGTARNSGLHCYFVPKQVVADGNGWGHSISWAHHNGSYYVCKYVYISDTTIKGNAINGEGNTTRSPSTLVTTNNRHVLWKVIGV